MTHNKSNMPYREIRLHQYRVNGTLAPYLDDWQRNPYTFFKSRLYTEASSLLVYLLQSTKVKPNTLSVGYALLGLFGGALLATAHPRLIILAVIIFFFKGILDWSDGHLARLKNETSITGAVLDPYGGFIGTLAFQTGFALYVANKAGNTIWYMAAVFVPFFYAASITSYGYNILFHRFLNKKMFSEWQRIDSTAFSANTPHIANKIGGKTKSFFIMLEKILDDRARTVDFICLLVVMETIFPIFVTWVVLIGFLAKGLILWVAFLYVVFKCEWAEEKLNNKYKELQ